MEGARGDTALAGLLVLDPTHTMHYSNCWWRFQAWFRYMVQRPKAWSCSNHYEQPSTGHWDLFPFVFTQFSRWKIVEGSSKLGFRLLVGQLFDDILRNLTLRSALSFAPFCRFHSISIPGMFWSNGNFSRGIFDTGRKFLRVFYPCLPFSKVV